MAYTDKNYKSKKALKEDVAAGVEVTIYNPGLGGDLSNFTGQKSLEGPHYPEAHKWYARVDVVDGVVVKVLQ